MKKTIIHAFEKGGVIYPPLEAECKNCYQSETRIIGLIGGEAIIGCYCDFIGKPVDGTACESYGLDLSKIPDEHEKRYAELEEAGELEDDEEAEAKKRELEEFLSL